MATATDTTIAQKLEALMKLQNIDSALDNIKKVRGDLPEEVRDLEDEIAGLETRLAKFQSEVENFNTQINNYRNSKKDSEKLIAKYKEQQMNVRNNREFDAVSKEIELQGLEMEIADKRIKEIDIKVLNKNDEIGGVESNLFERNKVEKDYLEIYKNVGLGTTIWSPLASGLLTGKYNDGIPDDSRFQLEGYEWLRDQWVMQDKINRVQQLGALAKALKVSTASLSIAWCIKNPNVSTAILGATRKEQLIDNLTAMETVKLLTPEIMEQIESIVETKPVQPEW